MYILGSDLKQELNYESLALTTPQPQPPDDSSGEQAELVEPVLILFHGTPVRDGEVGEGVRRECEVGEGVKRECEGGEVGEGVRRELEIGCIKTAAVKKVSVFHFLNPNTLICMISLIIALRILVSLLLSHCHLQTLTQSASLLNLPRCVCLFVMCVCCMYIVCDALFSLSLYPRPVLKQVVERLSLSHSTHLSQQ